MWTRNAIGGLGVGCVVIAPQVTVKQMRGVSPEHMETPHVLWAI